MYGLTEAFRSTYLPPERIDERPRSIGKAIPETEILVLDPSGRPCEPGEVGELVHRGPTVALGYWRDPEATARVFRPDPSGAPGLAVHSGDRVRRDEEGFLHYVGRADQLLKCSGYRLNPEEVEEVLLASGLVQEAVVRGEPDEAAGTRVVAHVVPRAGGAFSAAALLDWCRREMPGYMVPARIVEHAAFPRTSSLKIDRVSVRG
jgi:acyl-CoA synthetase (AMP-forming)/AMP-acid ligase II